VQYIPNIQSLLNVDYFYRRSKRELLQRERLTGSFSLVGGEYILTGITAPDMIEDVSGTSFEFVEASYRNPIQESNDELENLDVSFSFYGAEYMPTVLPYDNQSESVSSSFTFVSASYPLTIVEDETPKIESSGVSFILTSAAYF
jgi:hypothetical protein